MMVKIILAVLIIIHGLVHAGLAAAPDPNNPDSNPGAFFTSIDRSWLLSRMGFAPNTVRQIGIILVVLSTLGFVLTGMGIFGIPGLVNIWRFIAIVSACSSLLLLTLFWHPWLPVGVASDLGVLIALIVFHWPTVEIMGS